MTLAGYLRVSTDGQVEDGLGLAIQEQVIRDWCTSQGHRLGTIWRDEGVSGSNGIEHRDGLAGALEQIHTGAASGLVVARLDRLARALTVQEGILGRVWAWGGDVYTCDAGRVMRDDPDDPMRTAMRQMAGVFAELDARMIAKRLRDGRRAKADSGGYAGGAPAYGWRSVDGDLAPEPDEARVVEELCRWRGEGMSLRAIARSANHKGWRTKRGTEWGPEQVRRVVSKNRAVIAPETGG